jgi:hypothetical protein
VRAEGGEEAVEVVTRGARGVGRARRRGGADLVYHLYVLLASRGVDVAAVEDEHSARSRYRKGRQPHEVKKAVGGPDPWALLAWAFRPGPLGGHDRGSGPGRGRFRPGRWRHVLGSALAVAIFVPSVSVAPRPGSDPGRGPFGPGRWSHVRV